MASIIDRGEGRPNRWQVKYRILDPETGTWLQRSDSYSSHKAAKARKAELELDGATGQLIDPRKAEVTFAAFVAEVRPALERPLRKTSRARFGTALEGQVLP